MSVSRYISLTLNRVPAIDHSQRRQQRIAHGVVTGVACKGIGILVTICSVPLTLGYLGAERYGVWITISTLLAWLATADLGFANGLLPAVSEACGQERPDLAKQYVSTAFWGLTGVALFIGAVIGLVWPRIHWNFIFNVQSEAVRHEIPAALATAIVIFLTGIPLTIVNKIYLALQRGAVANFWTALGNLVSLLAILIVTRSESGIVGLVVAFSGSQLVVSAMSALWFFGWEAPSLRPSLRITASGAKKVLGVGFLFFVSQIAALLIYQTDSLVIAHYLGADQVTPYSVTWRLFGYVNVLQLLVAPYLWPAFGEAFARKDLASVRKMFWLYCTASVAVGIPLLMLVTACYEIIVVHWAGPAALAAPSVVIWMGIWCSISFVMSPIVAVLGGTGRLRNFAICLLIGAVLNVMLSVWMVRPFGPTGVIVATVVTYIPFTLTPAILELNRLLHPSQLNETS